MSERLFRVRMQIVLALLVVLSSLLTHGLFLRPENLVNVARQISLEALIAFGMTLVIVTGGIDLSVGSVVALAGIVAAHGMQVASGAGDVAAIGMGLLAAIICGTGCGAANGFVVTRFGLPPFIVTLATMLVARGLAFILCSGQPIYTALPPQLVVLGRGFVFESWLGRLLPVPVLFMVLGAACFHVLLTRTVLGRSLVAIGSNTEAARLAGIPVARTRLAAFAVTGGLCGLVGLLHASKLMAADPKAAEGWELNVIAAVVVGGTSLFGGRGSIGGTLVGAFIIGVLNNTLNLLHVEHFWQQVVLGLVLLGAALLDAGIARWTGKRTRLSAR